MKGIYWFQHDLRLQDNPALLNAIQRCKHLLCVYVVEGSSHCYGAPFQSQGVYRQGAHRQRFLGQSLQDLGEGLAAEGQQLVIAAGDPVAQIGQLIQQYNIDAVFGGEPVGWFERQWWRRLQQGFPQVEFVQHNNHRLFDRQQLPFELQDLPSTFTQFRKRVEPLSDPGVSLSNTSLGGWPNSIPVSKTAKIVTTQGAVLIGQCLSPELQAGILNPATSTKPTHIGGEQAALNHLQDYFSSTSPSNYKQTRNALDGWYDSTKFSPWLANGNLSVRRLMAAVFAYEQQHGENESSYWIKFELLWREYFQWYGFRHQQRLFAFAGITKRKPLTSFYPARFKRWCEGTTPYPIVNACMKQLNATGYVSNRGRQLVASCLVNELQLDWRYGAAYFEEQLLDYDVASNWGNWQYLAGVGADPQPGRHFNLAKQTATYDPACKFRAAWGESVDPQPEAVVLDSVDAVDWPLG